MNLLSYFVTAIFCENFPLGFSHNLPSFESVNEFHDYVFSFIMDHFSDKCVCFVKDLKHGSSLFNKLVDDVGKVKLVSLVSPIEETIPVDISRKEPFKPYPCPYVVHVPYVGSEILWLLLRGYYFPTGLNPNESRYLIVAEEFHSKEEIEQVLMKMFSYGFLNVDFLNLGDSQVDAYTLFPFGRDFESCPEDSPVTEKIATWHNGELRQFLPMFPIKLPDGLFNGCLWNISCAYFPPYLLVDNGGQFRGPLEGYDAGPLSLLAERLNLTPQWNIHGEDGWIKKLPNGTVAGSVPDVALGRGAQMSCGAVSLYWTGSNMDSTMFYTWSAVQWFVAAPNKVPKWKMLVFALDKSIWPFVVACALIVPTIYWLFCILCKQPQPFTHIVLSFTALGFGNLTSPPPVIFTLRLVFISWVIYVLHIDQCYLASLTGLITSAGYEPMIKTADELIRSNLRTICHAYTKIHLISSPKEYVQKLLRNYINTDLLLNYTLLEMTKFKNFTLAENQVYVKHTLSSLSNVSIYPTCIKDEEYTIGSLMWRHNYLLERINWLLIRMFDAGFPVYFQKKFVPSNQFWSDPMDKTARALNLEDLSGPFYILIVGLSLSCVVFLCEVVVFNVPINITKPKEK